MRSGSTSASVRGSPRSSRFQPENIRIHQTADPEVIVAEFDYVGTVLATGEPDHLERHRAAGP